MIIVLLKGGVGNQMFQYAMGRRLAITQGTDLALDLGYLTNPPPGDSPRPFELNHFNIVAHSAAPLDVAELGGKYTGICQQVLVGVRRIARLNRFRRRIYREPHFEFCQEVLKLQRDVYLEGYWQSDRYFNDVEPDIRQEFTFRRQMNEKSLEIAQHIESVEAVALHIRRGDYVTNPSASAFHGTCSLEYYHNAVELMAGRIGRPHFFIFSDEWDWAQQKLQLPYPHTFITHNAPDQGHEDLQLISLCKHAIIANSSFSWWGAWLISNPAKIVIAPRQWFAKPDINTADLIPTGWIQL